MIAFFTDLDNTLIYSYKHDIGNNKKCVEIYNERKISFSTTNTLNNLKILNNFVTIIPTSTRTIEQFNRINLGINFKYSLVCNGGILLIDGKKDNLWYEQSQNLVKDSIQEIDKAMSFLQNDPRRFFEQRYIENLFLFTKCHNPEKVVIELKDILNTSLVDVFNNGEKVYVIPIKLSKGMAVARFLEKYNYTDTISAGDSEFDLSMIETTSLGIIPENFPIQIENKLHIYKAHKNMIFSDELLNYIITNFVNQ